MGESTWANLARRPAFPGLTRPVGPRRVSIRPGEFAGRAKWCYPAVRKPPGLLTENLVEGPMKRDQPHSAAHPYCCSGLVRAPKAAHVLPKGRV